MPHTKILGYLRNNSPFPSVALSWGTARSLETNVYSVVMDYGVSRSKVAIHSVLKTGILYVILCVVTFISVGSYA